MTQFSEGILKWLISYVMRAIGVKLLEQRMKPFLSGKFFDWESRCDELMVINDAVPGDIDLINYTF